uniref:DIS3-like exonuclease 1 n=1 Tax=Lotharella oceanica TaxID=641309 RepID=A0A7S2TSI8_9EUKA
MSEAEYVCAGDYVTSKTAEGGYSGLYHYGLALTFYTHFTSPIRRYADIVVHRQLLDSVEKDNEIAKTPAIRDSHMISMGSVRSTCSMCNLRTRYAKNASKDSQNLFLFLYLKQYGPTIESAMVYSIKSNGVLLFIPSLQTKAACLLIDKNQKTRGLVLSGDRGNDAEEGWMDSVEVNASSVAGKETLNIDRNGKTLLRVGLLDFLRVKVSVSIDDARYRIPKPAVEILIGDVPSAAPKQRIRSTSEQASPTDVVARTLATTEDSKERSFAAFKKRDGKQNRGENLPSVAGSSDMYDLLLDIKSGVNDLKDIVTTRKKIGRGFRDENIREQMASRIQWAPRERIHIPNLVHGV